MSRVPFLTTGALCDSEKSAAKFSVIGAAPWPIENHGWAGSAPGGATNLKSKPVGVALNR